jgi:hypothetical protein
MRKVWANLFDEFQELSDTHHFSRMIKVGSGSKTIIEVTCTGSLSGLLERPAGYVCRSTVGMRKCTT